MQKQGEHNEKERTHVEDHKTALAQSLKKLLLQKTLTKITINDIAQDCGINRMTFYYRL